MAFLGGTETYGRFVDFPFPELVERETGVTCVNLGWPNAGIDVFNADPGLARIAAGARLTVLQVPPAANLSNGYFRVHPRRNDRFLHASGALEALYPEVDFTDFHFTRHMLTRLRAISPVRFARVHEELARVWTRGMQRLINNIHCPVVLLWMSARKPERHCGDPDVAHEPALVSRGMLDALKDMSARLIELDISDALPRSCREDLLVPRHVARAARRLPGMAAHECAARALVPVVLEMLET